MDTGFDPSDFDRAGNNFDARKWLKMHPAGEEHTPDELTDACEHVANRAELRSRLELDYARFNRVLLDLGEAPLSKEAELRQQYNAYLAHMRRGIIDRLRRHHAADFHAGRDLAAYIERKTLDFLSYDTDWILMRETLEMEAVEAHVTGLLADTLGEDIEVELPAYKHVQEENRKAVREFAMEAEPVISVWCQRKGVPPPEPSSQQGNRRKGTTRKTLKGHDGALPIDIPRDRDGSFEPELIKKGQIRIDGMDDKIIGLHAAGLSTRDTRAHLEEVCGLRVSADLISRVTDAVLEEVPDWQTRALVPVYPIVFPDALRVEIRDAQSRQVWNKAVYVALGVTPEGIREGLGLWIANNEEAKFWLSIMNILKNRGVEGILIAVVDGLKGFPNAINAAFPEDHCADLYRVSGASFPELLRLERPQGCRQKPEAH